MPASHSKSKTAQLNALRQSGPFKSLPEQAVDDITRLASQICGTPIAMISLLNEDRQQFISRVGCDMIESPREETFCHHTISQSELMIVPDAARDPRFADNPWLSKPPRVRFYAGIPLRVADDKSAVGSLCVLDHRPRRLTADQQESLRALARQVCAQIELSRTVADLKRVAAERQQAETALQESEQRFQMFMNNSPAIAYIKDEGGRYVYVNPLCASRFGKPAEEWMGQTDFDLWTEEVAQPLREHDMAVLSGDVARTLEEEVPTPDGDTECWQSHKFALHRADGRKELAGLSLDITERKRTEREREQLIADLRKMLTHVTTLKGLLPICSNCKNIRDDEGYWQQIDAYLTAHSHLEFTHGICPECVEKLYPESAKKLREEADQSCGKKGLG